MKTLFLTFLFLGCFFASDLFAQPQAKKPQFNVTHPSIQYSLVRPNINIEKEFCYDLSSDPFMQNPRKKFYKRSEDMLTDTMFLDNGASVYEWVLYRYNKKNQLIYGQGMTRNIFGKNRYNRVDYKYDEEGRMVREERNLVEWPTNALENSQVSTLYYEKSWDYSTIQKTEKGFIYNNIECELDDEGRITYIKMNADQEGMYLECNGKKYRVNDQYFAYTDSSYSEFLCEVISFTPELVLRFYEYTFINNENGDIQSEKMMFSVDGINWELGNNYRSEYLYKNHGRTQINSGDGDVANEIPYKSSTKVYAFSDEIRIYSEGNAAAQIFDLTGRLIKQQSVSSGESRINISKAGFYIVKVGNDSFKVFVR